MSDVIYVAVDFDGTCVKNKFPEVGESIGAEVVLREMVGYGVKLLLNTMRSGESLDAAVKWFQDNEIPLYGVNENPDQKTWTDSPKVYAHHYIDDLAEGSPLIRDNNVEPPYIDWNIIRQTLLPRLKPAESRPVWLNWR